MVSISWKPSGRLPAMRRLKFILAGARTNNPLLTVVNCFVLSIAVKGASVISVDIITDYSYFGHKNWPQRKMKNENAKSKMTNQNAKRDSRRGKE